MYKILKTEKVFSHPRHTVLKDEIKLKNGEVTDYIRFEHNSDANAIIPINKEGKILITKDYCHPIGDKIWLFPGGGVAVGDNSKDETNRELLEETGFISNDLTEIGWFYSSAIRRTPEKLFVFIGKDLIYKGQELEAEEADIEIHWLSFEEIENLVNNGDINNCVTLSIWMLYKNWLNNHS